MKTFTEYMDSCIKIADKAVFIGIAVLMVAIFIYMHYPWQYLTSNVIFALALFGSVFLIVSPIALRIFKHSLLGRAIGEYEKDNPHRRYSREKLAAYAEAEISGLGKKTEDES